MKFLKLGFGKHTFVSENNDSYSHIKDFSSQSNETTRLKNTFFDSKLFRIIFAVTVEVQQKKTKNSERCTWLYA
jgi:hypothetical protein